MIKIAFIKLIIKLFQKNQLTNPNLVYKKFVFAATADEEQFHKWTNPRVNLNA